MKIEISNNQKKVIKLIIKGTGMMIASLYMFISARNIFQFITNFDILVANKSIPGIAFNIFLYALVIAAGFEAVRRHDLYYIVMSLILIIIVF